MTPGVVSLRCPACSRPFLSLPQHSETFVACPHCGRAAAAGTFAAAGSPPPEPVSQSLRQRILQPPAPEPTPFQNPPLWPPAQPHAPYMVDTRAPHLPPAAAEPQWPFIAPEPYPPASPFAQAGLYFDQAGHGAHPDLPPSRPYGETYDPFPPRNPERNIPLAIFFLIVLSFAGWMLWDSLQPPLAFNVPAVPIPGTESADTAPDSAFDSAEPSPAPVPESVSSSESVLRADAPKSPLVDLAAAGEAAPKLLRALFKATSSGERASLIAEADLHRESIARFFRGAPLSLISVIPSKVTPQLQEGQAITPLFQVTTSRNTHGALLRLISQTDGSFLIEWPMFAETHERLLAQFVDEKSTVPTWFHVCLKRSQTVELPASLRTRHLCYDIQASADDSVRFYAGVEKEASLGRFFEHETEWGTVYVSRLLLQWRGVGTSEESVAILDCEGSRGGGIDTSAFSR